MTNGIEFSLILLLYCILAEVISLQTRQQFPNDIVLNNLKIAASTAGFSLRHVERVRQKNCPNMVKDAPKDDDDDDDD